MALPRWDAGSMWRTRKIMGTVVTGAIICMEFLRGAVLKNCRLAQHVCYF